MKNDKTGRSRAIKIALAKTVLNGSNGSPSQSAISAAAGRIMEKKYFPALRLRHQFFAGIKRAYPPSKCSIFGSRSAAGKSAILPARIKMARKVLNAARLVKSKAVVYCRAMLLKLSFTVAALLGCSASFSCADTIQLKDAAAVTGKVLTEKADSLVVDVGYTVLQIPRGSIVSVSKTAAADSAPVTTAPAASGQFYTATAKPGSVRDVSSLVKQIGEAVVQVKTPAGLGSGFFLNEDGYLITNFHVIEGETEISVEVYHQKNGQLDRETYKQVKIIAINKFHDLALLHIEDKDAPKFKSVALGTSDSLSVGEGVFAIGSPLGLERTVTQGIISTKTRQMEGNLFLQTSTQINPGNSGGPLFNLAGEVVGVTNMKINFGEGLGFAIPAELVKNFLDHRDAYAYSTDNPNTPFRYLEPPSRTKVNSTEVK